MLVRMVLNREQVRVYMERRLGIRLVVKAVTDILVAVPVIVREAERRVQVNIQVVFVPPNIRGIMVHVNIVEIITSTLAV